MKTFDYIKAAAFFPDYAPKVKNWKHKMRGFNGRGNPMEFSKDDIKEITKGLKKLYHDLIS